MAKKETIAKLHAQSATVADLPTGDERSESDNLSYSPRVVSAPPERKVRARFQVSEPHAEVTAYTLSPEIMATVAASEPLDRSAAFARLAMRQAALEQAKRFGRRGPERWRRSEHGWPTISM